MQDSCLVMLVMPINPVARMRTFFSHVGKPWLTQYWVRQVAKQTYGDITPERGYGENDEDQGQMAGIKCTDGYGIIQFGWRLCL